MRARLAALGGCVASLAAALAADPAAGAPSAPELQPVASLEARDPIHWMLKTDTGLLAVYADDGLHVFDLLEDGKRVGKPIPLPGAKRRRKAAHVPGTNLLLITGAGPSLATGNPAEAVSLESAEAIDPLDTAPFERAYAVHLTTGRVLWDTESFAAPMHALLFPREGVIVIRSGFRGNRFAAVDAATGRRLWSSVLSAQYAERKGGVLEVLGEDSGRIDPLSGQRRWGFSAPAGLGHRLLPFPTRGLFVVWDDNDFGGFAVPDPDAAGAFRSLPETVTPKSIWRFEAEDRMSQQCVASRSCWARVIPGNRLIVVSKHHVELVDAATGKAAWRRDKEDEWKDFLVSPSGKTGVDLVSGGLVVVGLENGEDLFRIERPEPQSGAAENHVSRWLGDHELLVVSCDTRWRPRAMAKYDLAGRRLLWGHTLPDPANFPLTAGQRGGTVAAVLGVLAIGAAVALAPAPYPPAPILIPPPIMPFPYSAPWMANLYPDGLAADEMEDAAAGTATGSGLPEGIQALDRRRERARRIREAESSEFFAVSGEDGAYRVLAVDIASGSERLVSEYRRRKVHSMDFDAAAQLVISTEDNRRVLRLLAPGRLAEE